MIRHGVLYTPPLSTILEGITRDSIIKIAKEVGLQVRETQITRDQLYIADEVFITGTAAEVVGVSAIDTRLIGSGRPGPLTRQLSIEFTENLHGRGRFSSIWLDYVPDEPSTMNP
jgi:branched-chain amino acid aminotransferase